MTVIRPRTGAGGSLLKILLLAAMGAAAVYARVMLNPVQDVVRVALRLSDNQMSIVQGFAICLPIILLWAPLGRVIDRGSRIRLLRILLTICLAGGALSSIAAGFVSLCLTRGALGCAGLAMIPLIYSLVADAVPTHFRGRANTLIAIGQSGGMAAPFLLVSALPIGLEWRMTLRILALPFVLLLAISFFLAEPAREAGEADLTPESSALRPLFGRYRYVLLIILGENCAEVCLGAQLVWALPFFSRGLGMTSTAAASLAGSIFLATGILGSIFGGGLIDLLGKRGGPAASLRLLAWLSLLTAACGAAMLFKADLVAIVAFTLLALIGNTVTLAGLTVLTNAVPEESRGTALSLWVTCATVSGVGIAPLAASLSAGLFTGRGAIGLGFASACVAISVVGALVFWAAERSWRASRAALPSTNEVDHG